MSTGKTTSIILESGEYIDYSKDFEEPDSWGTWIRKKWNLVSPYDQGILVGSFSSATVALIMIKMLQR